MDGSSAFGGFQSNIKDLTATEKIVRFPDGSAQAFKSNGDGTYSAEDSRSILNKQVDNSFILTTKDQYYNLYI